MLPTMDQIARTTKDLGNVLRQARKARNLTQADLAARAGIWQRTVSNIETSASGAKVDTIFDLLAALDLELHIVPRSKMAPGDLEDIF
jgi:HTH-type transcriptional regulator/antitoxin HipB